MTDKRCRWLATTAQKVEKYFNNLSQPEWVDRVQGRKKKDQF